MSGRSGSCFHLVYLDKPTVITCWLSLRPVLDERPDYYMIAVDTDDLPSCNLSSGFKNYKLLQHRVPNLSYTLLCYLCKSTSAQIAIPDPDQLPPRRTPHRNRKAVKSDSSVICALLEDPIGLIPTPARPIHGLKLP